MEAFFLPAPAPSVGQRLCVYHPARGAAARSAVVYVHPFAEEMNKSRRMAALQARALADAGHAVLQIDLFGCGDSSGDFEDASWAAWVNDVVHACSWIKAHVRAPLWLWGLRAGCLLATDAARQLEGPSHLLLWQPATSGKQVLQQFLRLKVAGDMLDGQHRSNLAGLRSQLAASNAVDVAGYRLSAALANGLEQAELRPCVHIARLEWLELSTRADAALLPASLGALAQWHEAGCSANAQVVNGPPFWQATEIEEAPALIEATLAVLNETVRA